MTSIVDCTMEVNGVDNCLEIHTRLNLRVSKLFHFEVNNSFKNVKEKSPTSNDDIVVVFMCANLINTIILT